MINASKNPIFFFKTGQNLRKALTNRDLLRHFIENLAYTGRLQWHFDGGGAFKVSRVFLLKSTIQVGVLLKSRLRFRGIIFSNPIHRSGLFQKSIGCFFLF